MKAGDFIHLVYLYFETLSCTGMCYIRTQLTTASSSCTAYPYSFLTKRQSSTARTFSSFPIRVAEEKTHASQKVEISELNIFFGLYNTIGHFQYC